MAHKHTHDHGHSHEHEHEPVEVNEQLDAASQSLSEALRISFVILKVIMIVLVVAFLASGFKTVAPNEQALVLRFGKIQGTAEARALGSGFHWIFPYPIDEMVKIPVEQQINLTIKTFWYRESAAELANETPPQPERVSPTLNPMIEGYNLTRSEDIPRSAAQQIGLTESEASDYSIVHTKWKVVYQIGNIEQFFTSVYVQDVAPGQLYSEIMQASVEPLLQCVVEDAVVNAMARYSIDQALQSTDTIRRNVRELAQQKLDDIGSGLQISSIQLEGSTWPKQVDDAFQAFVRAGQDSSRARTEAQTDAENTLNEAVGRVARTLYSAVTTEDADPNELDTLWSQVAGQAQTAISGARTYRTEVVASAEANAKYLDSILEEYRKRPELVTQQLYLDAIDEVLKYATEKFVLQPSDSERGQQIRVLVNRDPALRRQQRQTQPGATDQSAASR